jgi:hypothetical protein
MQCYEVLDTKQVYLLMHCLWPIWPLTIRSLYFYFYFLPFYERLGLLLCNKIANLIMHARRE